MSVVKHSHNIGLIALYAALAAVGGYLKLFSPLQASESNYQEYVQVELFQKLNSAGLQLIDSTKLSNNHTYNILTFSHPQCAGFLSIVALHRNAEGLHLLDSNLSGQVDHSGFIYQEAYHISYPNLKVWWQHNIHHRLFKHPKKPIFRFAEAGYCSYYKLLLSNKLITPSPHRLAAKASPRSLWEVTL